LVLVYDDEELNKEQKENKNFIFVAPAPQLRMISFKGEEIFCDNLAITNFEKYNPKDYRLEYNGVDRVYYILSRSCILIAKERTVEDRIKWLCENNEYQEALNVAKLHEGL
jgi:hypothetical protein